MPVEFPALLPTANAQADTDLERTGLRKIVQ